MKKHVMITGGSSEIGIATCETFLNKNYTVILNIKTEKNKNKIIKYLNKKFKYNSDYFIYVFDIGDLNKSNIIFKKIFRRFKVIDCLINNATITDNKVAYNINNFEKIFQTNLFGTLNCILNFVDQKNKKKKFIVNLSSEVSDKGSINFPAYASSKAAIDNLTKSISALLIKKNIQINSILPSLVLTSKLKKNKNIQLLEKKLPIKRVAKPLEIANLIYFLCSDNSTYISGSFIKINGGNNY